MRETDHAAVGLDHVCREGWLEDAPLDTGGS